MEMRSPMRYAPLALAVLLTAPPLMAADTAPVCTAPSTCVSKEDLDVFVTLLREQKCRAETLPTLKADPVTVIVDREGRIYGSGDDPKPYKLHIGWCNYQVDVTSQIQLVAAQRIEPTYGFRFRAKATIGFLPVEAVQQSDAGKGIDAGLLLEPFFLQWANINAYVGIRSFGAGLGFDAVKNVSLYVGYSMTYSTWRSQPYFGVGFALW